MDHDFVIGATAKVKKNSDAYDMIGLIGKIIKIDNDIICLEFPKPIERGHDGQGSGKLGYCFWFIDDEVCIVENGNEGKMFAY